VSPGEREGGCRMVKCRRLPDSRVVALRAVVTEVAGHVIGIGGLLKIRLMTLEAIRVMDLIVAIHMA